MKIYAAAVINVEIDDFRDMKTHVFILFLAAKR